MTWFGKYRTNNVKSLTGIPVGVSVGIPVGISVGIIVLRKVDER